MSDAESSQPGPLSASGVPSSFDSSPEFFEESRSQKLWRKLKQEPLIPLGCAATCYALYQATRSIRQGDHHQTNRMFRARVYAQGFTLLALVAGSLFYRDERLRRKAFEGVLEEKKVAEKREKWLKELDARDREDKEWRQKIEGVNKTVPPKGDDDEAKKAVEAKFSSKSVREEVVREGWGPGTWVSRVRDSWRRM